MLATVFLLWCEQLQLSLNPRSNALPGVDSLRVTSGRKSLTMSVDVAQCCMKVLKQNQTLKPEPASANIT